MSKDQYYKRLESLFSSSDSVAPEPVNGKTAPVDSESAGLRARLAEVEVALAEAQRQAAAARQSQLAESATVASRVAELEAELAEARQQALAHQQAEAQRQAETVASLSRVAELEAALTDALKQIRENQQSESQHRAQTEAMNHRVAELERAIETAHHQLSANDQWAAKQRAEAAALRERTAELETALAEAREQTPQPEGAESAALKTQIAELETMLAEARREADASRQAQTDQQTGIAALHNRIGEIETALAQATEQVSAQQQIIVRRQTEAAQLQARLFEAEAALSTARPASALPKTRPLQESIDSDPHTLSDAELRAILAEMTDVILIYDSEGRYLRIAPTNPSKLLKPPTELLGRTMHEIMPAAKADELLSHIRRALSTQETVQTHYALSLSEGEFWFEATISPLGHDKVFWIARDITERKQAEEALLRQSEYLAVLQETTLGLVGRLDLAELLEDIVAKAADLVGTPHGYIFLHDPEEGVMRMHVGVGTYSSFVGYKIKPGGAVVGTVWQTGQPLVVENYQTWAKRLNLTNLEPVRAVVGVPLKAGDEVAGVLGLAYVDPERRFGDAELDLINRFAQLAAIALDNARSFASAQKELAERRQAEDTAAKHAAELEETTRFLDSVIENLPVMLFVKEANELRYVRWNRAGEELLGISREQMTGTNAYDSFTKEEADRFTAQDRELLNSGKPLDIPEETVQTAHKGTRIIHTRKIPILGADGEPKFLLGFSDDITERKQIEQQAAIQASALDAAGNAVVITTRDGIIQWVNPAFTLFTGYTAEEVVGQKNNLLKSGRHDRAFYEEMWNTILAGNVWRGEVINRRKDGSLYYEDQTITPVKDVSGEIIRFVSIKQDITARKQAEETLAKRATELATVAQVSTDAVSILDPQELLQKVVDLAKAQFNLYHAHIYLLNEVEGMLVLTAGAGAIGRRMVADGRRIPIAQVQSLVARAARTRRGVTVNDVTQDPGWLPNPLLPNTRSEMAIPMLVGNRLLGVFDVQSDIMGRFSEEDVRIQTTLAAQIAVALQNAQQFDQTQAAIKDLEVLNRRLTRESWQDYVSAQSTSRLGYTYDLNQLKRIENGEVVIENNGAAIEHALTIHGETIGRLAIAEAEQADADASEIVAAVAEQLSAHLENLRLTEQAEAARHTSDQQAANLARLAEIGNLLAQAKTDEDILLAVVGAAEQTNLLSVTLNYIEAAEGYRPISTRTVAHWARGGILRDSPFLHKVSQLKDYPASDTWINRPLDAWLVEDIHSHPDVDENTRSLFGRGGGGALVTVPLFSGGVWQGIVFYVWSGPREFTAEDRFIFPAINEPTAAAVAARRAYLSEEAARQQSEQRATELEAIAKVSAAAASILDSNQLLQSVVDLTKTDLDLYHAHIYLLDETDDHLELAAGAGEVGRRMVAAGFRIPVNRTHSLVARAARTRKGVISNDVLQEPDFLPNPYLPDTRSELAVPMIVGDKLIGVFDVQSDAADRFTDADIVLKTTLAEQVAVALQNTRLFAEQASTLERLRELDQLKSSFLANMSHELRTPLNSILGFAQVMLEGIDGDITTQMENDLQVIQKNGQHLLNLISDILDMAKIEAGKMTLNTEIFDLKETMEEVVEITTPMARAKSINVLLNANTQQTLDIYADRMRLRQVMINIVNNAIKFTDQGYIELSAVRESGLIRVSVKDTGIGIPASHLNKIFEEFSQVDSSTTRKAGGTGLGLPISRHLVELHGGKLWAESTGVPGEGATFVIELPVETTYVN